MLKRSEKVFEYELPIKIEPQKEGGFVVTCPLWSDCYAQGDTLDEAVLEITGVAQSLIELYKEEGLKIPLKLQKTKTVKDVHLSVSILTAA
ncbi:MAG: type II toxin-antitoxin system HicB family antitoxin [Patescibacteria group bacterium]|nr:type II toxin-antitoxin system HicB family antitoxin [Patescibacteria group bacterium]